MTFAEIHSWCRANGVDVRGIYRGKDFFIRAKEEIAAETLPAIGQVFHWDVELDGKHYPTSPSDMERLVNGKMSLENFRGTHRGG